MEAVGLLRSHFLLDISLHGKKPFKKSQSISTDPNAFRTGKRHAANCLDPPRSPSCLLRRTNLIECLKFTILEVKNVKDPEDTQERRAESPGWRMSPSKLAEKEAKDAAPCDERDYSKESQFNTSDPRQKNVMSAASTEPRSGRTSRATVIKIPETAKALLKEQDRFGHDGEG